MNDRFRFRVAVKQGLEWQIYDVLNILFKNDGTIWVQTIRESESATFTAWMLVDGENVILEQCTGLTDKNGKLIFEGDVVRCITGVVGKVVYFYTGFKVVFDDPMSYPCDIWENQEILGNIHEMGVES